jgi:hypothetical protein
MATEVSEKLRQGMAEPARADHSPLPNEPVTACGDPTFRQIDTQGMVPQSPDKRRKVAMDLFPFVGDIRIAGLVDFIDKTNVLITQRFRRLYQLKV